MWVKGATGNVEIAQKILGDQVSTMAYDALDPCITRSSAAMALILQDKLILLFQEEEYQCVISMVKNDKYTFRFSGKILAQKIRCHVQLAN